jgi:hypothetical protein
MLFERFGSTWNRKPVNRHRLLSSGQAGVVTGLSSRATGSLHSIPVALVAGSVLGGKRLTTW